MYKNISYGVFGSNFIYITSNITGDIINFNDTKLNLQTFNDTLNIESRGNWSADKPYYATKTELDYKYAGFIQFTNPIDNGDGTLTIATQDANLYSTADGSGALNRYTITGGITGTELPVIPQGKSYMVGIYNGGSPVFNIIIDRETIHQTNVIPYLSLYREGNTIEILTWDSMANAMSEKINDRLVRTQRFTRETGFALSEPSNGVVKIATGINWWGSYRTTLPDLQSDENITKFFYHNSDGTWNFSYVNTYNNTVYDNGTSLVPLGDNNYTINWVYIGNGIIPKIYIVMGIREHTTIDSSDYSVPLDIPTEVQILGMLVGGVIVQKNANTSSSILNVFTTTYSSGTATDHNSLPGLQGGLAGEYYHLTGDQLTANIERSLVWKTDAVNRIAGINAITGQASFQVTTLWLPRSGNLTTTEYDEIEDTTTVEINNGNTYGFDSGAFINISDNFYYVYYIINETSFQITGNISFTEENWMVRAAPYVDVSGDKTSERGYSISDETGAWQWIMYTPYQYNGSVLCFANSNQPYSLDGSLCIDDTGQINTLNLIAEQMSLQNYNQTNSIYSYGNVDNYFQLFIQNLNNGNNATTELVTFNDDVNYSIYMSIGTASTNYSAGSINNGTKANDSFIYNEGGDIGIFTGTLDKVIQFFTGGYSTNNLRAKINDSGLYEFNSRVCTASNGVCLINESIANSLGNWSLDKPNYWNSTVVNQTIIGPWNFSNWVNASGLIVNWSKIITSVDSAFNETYARTIFPNTSIYTNCSDGYVLMNLTPEGGQCVVMSGGPGGEPIATDFIANVSNNPCGAGTVVQSIDVNGVPTCVAASASTGGNNNAVVLNNVNTYNTVTSIDNSAYPSTALINNVIYYSVTDLSDITTHNINITGNITMDLGPVDGCLFYNATTKMVTLRGCVLT